METGHAVGKQSLGHRENIRKVFIFVWGLIEHRSYLILMVIKQDNDSAYRTVLSRPSGRRGETVKIPDDVSFWSDPSQASF